MVESNEFVSTASEVTGFCTLWLMLRGIESLARAFNTSEMIDMIDWSTSEYSLLWVERAW